MVWRRRVSRTGDYQRECAASQARRVAYDTSPGCAKTYRLIDSTAPLAERLIRLARVPGLRSLTRRLLRVADDVLH